MRVTNVWHLLNLDGSPFFQDRLAPGGSAAHPIDLFVGRDGEAELLMRSIIASDSSRQAIPGAVGRGKTTLAQFVKSEMARVRFVAAEEPVSVGSADTAAELLMRILSSVYQAILAHGDSTTADQPPMILARQLLRAFQTHGAGFSLTLGIPGVGSVGRSSSTSFVTGPGALLVMAPDLLRQVAALARDHLGAAGVIVHLNNLENLAESDAERAARVLRDLRDTALMVSGVHYLLVGTDAAVRAVVQGQAQMRSVFHVLPSLAPLTDDEVLELLARRYEHLRRDPRAPAHPPATDAAVLEVYALFRGDLRGTLGALERAAVRLAGVAGDAPTDPMDTDAVRSVLKSVYLDEIDAAVAPTDLDLLELLTDQFGEDEFSQGDAAEASGLSPTTISDAFVRLTGQGFLLALGKRSKPGPGRRPMAYGVSGAVRLALG